jgi:plasmid stability protein
VTQLTIRNVDDDLAARVRGAAEESGDSINGLLLKVLRHQFGSLAEETPERNDLSKFRRGWVEDPEADAAMAEFEKVDQDAWK